jgi:hypothetical protein
LGAVERRLAVVKVEGARGPRDPDRAQRKVVELVARAGIIEPREEGDGTLITEPILVFRGRSGSSLQIFDQHGNEIGSARHADSRYELRDREIRCTVRELSKRAKGLEYELVVAGPDGRELGKINHDKPRLFGAWEGGVRIISRGRMIALLRRDPGRWVAPERVSAFSWISRAHYLVDHVSCCRFSIGVDHAWITYVRPSILPYQVSYVLELPSDTTEPLRTMTLAAVIVVDNKEIKQGGNGGGGGA